MNVTLTQELLAGMIGVRRTSVTLAAASLQAEGIIKYSRGRIQIVDIERLKQLSCECYQTLKDGVEVFSFDMNDVRNGNGQ